MVQKNHRLGEYVISKLDFKFDVAQEFLQSKLVSLLEFLIHLTPEKAVPYFLLMHQEVLLLLINPIHSTLNLKKEESSCF